MCEKPVSPKDNDEDNHLLYQIVANRRTNCDTKMWQAPVLSLTAQAFLLTIALGADSSRLARVISAALAILAAGASIQLMARHRRFEVADSLWLEDYEKGHFGMTLPGRALHGKPRPFFEEAGKEVPSGRFGSYNVWWWVLAVFGLAGLFTALIGTFCPSCLQSH